MSDIEGLSNFIADLMGAVREYGTKVIELTLDAADIYDQPTRDEITAEVQERLEGRWPG